MSVGGKLANQQVHVWAKQTLTGSTAKVTNQQVHVWAKPDPGSKLSAQQVHIWHRPIALLSNQQAHVWYRDLPAARLSSQQANVWSKQALSGSTALLFNQQVIVWATIPLPWVPPVILRRKRIIGMATKVPKAPALPPKTRQVPNVPAGLDPQLRNFLSAVREVVNDGMAGRSAPKALSPTSRLLSQPGSVQVSSTENQAYESGLKSPTFWDDIGRLASAADSYTYTGLLFKPNDPTTNKLTWTAGTATKNGGQTWDIAAETAGVEWISGILYVYYVPGDDALRTAESLVFAIADGGRILATYKGGTDLTADAGRAFIDGDTIIAGTIGASQLVVDTAVITTSAQIANALIDAAHIGTAEINSLHVAGGAITAPEYAMLFSFTPAGIDTANSAASYYDNLLTFPIATTDIAVTRLVNVSFSVTNNDTTPGEFEIEVEVQQNGGDWNPVAGSARTFDVGTKQIIGQNDNGYSFMFPVPTLANASVALKVNLTLRNGIENKWNNTNPPVFKYVMVCCFTGKR